MKFTESTKVGRLSGKREHRLHGVEATVMFASPNHERRVRTELVLVVRKNANELLQGKSKSSRRTTVTLTSRNWRGCTSENGDPVCQSLARVVICDAQSNLMKAASS